MSELLDAALAYAAKGWRVFPVWWPRHGACACPKGQTCGSPGKHPLTANGCLDATTDITTIEGWWLENPRANVGIAMGAESGIWGLDIDTAKGGEITFEELQRNYGALPISMRAKSGSGGLHVFFRYPDARRISNSTSKIGPGIDCRGAGGYLVAPPSQHISGGKYTWLDVDEEPLEDAPDWLLDLASAATKEAKAAIPSDITLDPLPAVNVAEKAYGKALREVAEGQSRHVAFVRFTQQCHDNAVPEAVASLYLPLFKRVCDSSPSDRIVPERELWTVLNWAYAGDRRDPWDSVREMLEEKRAAIAAPPTFAEWLAEPLPDHDWLIDGLIPASSLIILLAESRAGKSTLTTQMLMCMASGQPFLGMRVRQPRRVLYIAAEGNRKGRRDRALAAKRALDIHDNIPFHVEPADFTEFTFRAGKVRELVLSNKFDLVVGDTLGLMWGGDDENDNASWGNLVMAPIREMQRSTGASFLLITHPPKTGIDGGARGAGRIFADSDTFITLEWSKQLSDPYRRLIVEKQKMAEEAPAMRLIFDKENAIFRRA